MASTDLSLFLLAQSVGARPPATPLAEEMVALLGRGCPFEHNGEYKPSERALGRDYNGGR
jgi:hypothetical protein